MPEEEDAVPAHLQPPTFRRRDELLTALACLVLATVVVVTSAYVYPNISLFDEITHADYARHASQLELVRRGDVLSQEMLDEWACRGPFDGSDALPDCGSGPYVPAEFPGLGINYNHSHPPTYYVVTGMGARALQAVTGIDSFVLAARLVGILWLAAGMYLVQLAARWAGVGPLVARCVGLLAAFLPTVIHASSTVTNDAAALVAGAGVLVLGLQVLAGRRHPAWLVPATLAVTSLKVLDIVAIVPVGVLALVAAWRGVPRRDSRAFLLWTAAAGAAGLAVHVAFTRLQAIRAPDGEYVNPVSGANGVPIEGFPIRGILQELLDFFPPVRGGFRPPAIDGALTGGWQAVVTVLLAGTPVVLLLLGPRVRSRALGAGVALGLVAAALLVELQYSSSGEYLLVDPNPRYGLPLLAGVLVCTAVLADRNRWTRWAAAAVTGTGGVVVVGSLTVAALR